MENIVQNLFAQKANPIGVDFGSDGLRMAQVQWIGEEYAGVTDLTALLTSKIGIAMAMTRVASKRMSPAEVAMLDSANSLPTAA